MSSSAWLCWQRVQPRSCGTGLALWRGPKPTAPLRPQATGPALAQNLPETGVRVGGPEGDRGDAGGCLDLRLKLCKGIELDGGSPTSPLSLTF